MFHTAAIIKTLKRKGFFIMYQIDFHKPMHIHFIGIGGISMSGLTLSSPVLTQKLRI